ncbi:hypothetical protein, partial [Pseudomonas sp. JUb42]|uniref:hypothetical protein n=1 Tax=Pseudomonas sp. JUb42 TaxID=2940611 RepID=UPI0021684B24
EAREQSQTPDRLQQAITRIKNSIAEKGGTIDCGSEFIREEAGTSDASSSLGAPLSRMNSLPQSFCDSVSCALFGESEVDPFGCIQST